MEKLKVNQESIAWDEQRSPGGRFVKFRRHLTQALGYARDPAPGDAAMPFDIEMTRIPPGCANYPYHQHATQWEAYLILDGEGVLRTDDGENAVRAGDFVVCPPGKPHQLRNDGERDLTYYVIADNPASDLFYYPDSDKYGKRPGLKFFRMVETDYYEGEDDER